MADSGIGDRARFGDLLRQLRIEADLTQEALAERAGLSVRAISDLERGVKRAPRFDTMRMLADGLGLTGEARQRFAAAARRDAVPPGPRRAPRPEPDQDGTPLPSAPLPEPGDDLLGRDAERTEVADLLRSDLARVVTLTGPGGVGKTRLGLAVAADVRSAFRDGIAVVELAPLADPALVPAAVAIACGLRDAGGADPVAALRAHLRERTALLLVDNCEHLLAAVGDLVARLVAGCPALRVLATSRSRLGLRAEREVPLAPLPLPAADGPVAPRALAENPAVRLFVERARTVDPAFALTERNAAAVAEIVRRLDGLPLAIELAAARAKVLPPAALLTRLVGATHASPLRLLTGGPRDLPARQQTLRDAIAWSYDLLTPEQRALFRRLAVFSGGFTLDAADYVGVEAAGTAPDTGEDVFVLEAVLDGLEALVDASLLRRLADVDGDGDGEPRFAMLETIREFGLERLDAEGEATDVRRRHVDWYLRLARRAEPELTGPGQGEWLDRLAAEHDNLRAALAWSLEAEPDQALRLVAALWRFWWIRGHLSEGRQWLDRALDRGGERDASARSERAAALYGLATLATVQGDLDRAAVAAEESAAISREVGDRLGLAKALVSLGSVAAYRGEQDRATALFEQGLALYRELGVKIGVPDVLNELGTLAYLRGEFARAAAYYEESLVRCRELGNEQAIAVALVNLGDACRRGGELDRAEGHLVEALVRSRALGDRPGIAAALTGLGQVARLRGETSRAAERFAEALALFRDADDAFGTAECLEGLGRCALAGGDAEEAARLFSASESLREAAGAPLPAPLRAELDRDVAALRAALPPEAFAVAWTTGRVRPIEEIVAGVGRASA